jgi:hypothetical protein
MSANRKDVGGDATIDGLRLRARLWTAALVIAGSFLITGSGTAQEDSDWPREFTAPRGAQVVVYQPQLDALEGNMLSGRTAVSVQLPEAEAPVFGAVWFEARIEANRDTRSVAILDLTVPRVRFAEATPEQEEQLASLLEKEVPSWDLTISLDRVLTALGVAESQRQAAEGLKNDPPEILFATNPTILVIVDGEPQLQQIQDTAYQYVANSPFVIVFDPKKVNFYLYASKDTWYGAKNIRGPWVVVKKVPKKIAELIPAEVDQQLPESAGDEEPVEPPAIIVRTTPTELIVSQGKPEFKTMSGGELLYMSNSESDVLLEIATQRYFVLLSGRWYVALTLDGPWSFVAADDLPESFAAIETDSEMAHLRSWVAGTEEAEEAVLDAQIPQTAAIKRDATIEVAYDGQPKFEPITGTDLQYAVNTASQVIQVEGRYYALEEGVWYVAAGPNGPWAVATEVPQKIYEQPPSSPTYNTTYVYVYNATPSVVYTGYYPGYMYSYHYRGCMVYGTGYYYPSWSGRYYYPRHSTWGLHVRWNSYSGWSMGASWSSGPFTFGMSWGGWGGSYRGGWYPPGGYYGYGRAYNRGFYEGARAGYRAGYRQGRTDQIRRERNLYNQGRNRNRVASSTRPTAAKRPAAVGSRPNNVYTDRSGNVYRRAQDGNWQQRQGGSWSDSDLGSGTRSRSGDLSARQRASGTPSAGNRPSSGTRSRSGDPSSRQRVSGSRSTGSRASAGSRPSTGSYSRGGGSLQRDYRARQRGSQRTRSYREAGAVSGSRRR